MDFRSANYSIFGNESLPWIGDFEGVKYHLNCCIWGVGNSAISFGLHWDSVIRVYFGWNKGFSCALAFVDWLTGFEDTVVHYFQTASLGFGPTFLLITLNWLDGWISYFRGLFSNPRCPDLLLLEWQKTLQYFYLAAVPGRTCTALSVGQQQQFCESVWGRLWGLRVALIQHSYPAKLELF